jgi:hypothetical protein
LLRSESGRCASCVSLYRGKINPTRWVGAPQRRKVPLKHACAIRRSSKVAPPAPVIFINCFSVTTDHGSVLNELSPPMVWNVGETSMITNHNLSLLQLGTPLLYIVLDRERLGSVTFVLFGSFLFFISLCCHIDDTKSDVCIFSLFGH